MLFEFKTKIKWVLFLVFFALTTSASAEVFKEFSGQVNAHDINLRVDATTGAAVIVKLAKGDIVQVVGEAYDWYKIRLPKAAPSYIKKNLVECVNLANSLSVDNKNSFAANSARCLSARVVGDRVNIRLGPSESTWILGKLDKLSMVNIRSEENGWYKIEALPQSYGWVNKKFINQGPFVFKPEGEQEFLAPGLSSKARAVKESLSVGKIELEGEVGPYGIVLWRKATHKLVTSQGKIYLLMGDRRRLDSLNYHKIRVQGKINAPTTSRYPIIEIDTLEALN